MKSLKSLPLRDVALLAVVFEQYKPMPLSKYRDDHEYTKKQAKKAFALCKKCFEFMSNNYQRSEWESLADI